jgi:hypothetical protein
LNDRISAASFCRQVAALVPDMFSNICLVKNHKIANNSETTENRDKISTNLESSILRILEIFYVCFTKFENYQILLHKISHQFQETNKLFSGRKSLIVLSGKLCALSN